MSLTRHHLHFDEKASKQIVKKNSSNWLLNLLTWRRPSYQRLGSSISGPTLKKKILVSRTESVESSTEHHIAKYSTAVLPTDKKIIDSLANPSVRNACDPMCVSYEEKSWGKKNEVACTLTHTHPTRSGIRISTTANLWGQLLESIYVATFKV